VEGNRIIIQFQNLIKRLLEKSGLIVDELVEAQLALSLDAQVVGCDLSASSGDWVEAKSASTEIGNEAHGTEVHSEADFVEFAAATKIDGYRLSGKTSRQNDADCKSHMRFPFHSESKMGQFSDTNTLVFYRSSENG